MSGRRAWPVVLTVGLLASQAGHLLAYQLRFGAAAMQVQSAGAHAYFPLLAKTALGVAAAAFLVGVLMVGLARILTRRSAIRTDSRRSLLGLVAILFTIQLAAFIGQEVGEALLAGARVDTAPHLLLWGTLGQLPVAAIAAIGLGWLAVRFESAVSDLRELMASAPSERLPSPVTIVLHPSPARGLLLAQVAGASLAKRGPPIPFRLNR